MAADPHASFSIFAEVSVALAGFSGIVMAFGHQRLENLSALEVRRLANLFMFSGFVLIASLLSIALLHSSEEIPDLFWPAFSALIFVFGTTWLAYDIYKVRQLSAAGAHINLTLVTLFDSLAALILTLQFYNCLWLQQTWPTFVALTLITAGAFQQFILLVQMHMRTKGSP